MNIPNVILDKLAPMDTHKTITNLLFITVFFLFGGGMIMLTGHVERSWLARSIWACIYVSAMGYGFLISRLLLSRIVEAPGFMVLSVLCLFSIFWSSAPSTTASYAIALFGATLIAYIIVLKLEAFQLLKNATTALLLLIVVNVLLMIPNLGYNLSGAGRFSGIFPQANMLGRMASLGILLLSLLALSDRYPKFLAGIGIIGGTLLVLACNSMTSIMAVILSLSLFFLRRSIGRPVGDGVILIMSWLLLCCGGLLWLNSESIVDFLFNLIGRSPTLTGRTGLWEGVRDAIYLKPILGYGYSGFWTGEHLLTERIFNHAGWETESAHNGLYEIALNVGLVGVVTFILVIGCSLLNAFKFTFTGHSKLAPVLLSILTYLLILGATESAYMIRNSINWVLMTLCTLYLKKLSLEEGMGRVLGADNTFNAGNYANMPKK
jgi:exopolysaccharide production protein ExoQ